MFEVVERAGVVVGVAVIPTSILIGGATGVRVWLSLCWEAAHLHLRVNRYPGRRRGTDPIKF